MAHLPGEFEVGAVIKAHDHEELATKVNTVYGLGTGASGYGSVASVAADLPSKPSTGLIENEDWRDDLKDAWEATAAHQSIVLADPLPLDSNLEDGDLIGFGTGTSAPLFANFDSTPNFNNITANKDVHTGESFSLDPAVVSVRTTSWGVKIEHQVVITFASQDDARAHFNTGGDVRIEATRTLGAATPHNAAWTALLAAAGNIYVFDGADYFGLTTTFATVFLIEDTTLGPYDIGLTGPITWRIQAKSDTIVDPGGRGGRGSVITINSSFLDQHIAHPGDPDVVDGTFTSSMRSRRSSSIFVKPVPGMATDLTPPPLPVIPVPIVLTLGF